MVRRSARRLGAALGTAAVAVLLVGCTGSGPGTTGGPGSSSSGSIAPIESRAPGSGRPVVIDTDMAPDDWVAILFLLGRPDIDVAAITVTGAGESHCGPGVAHARGLVALAGRPEIPVACGRETPLAGSHGFPAEWRAGADGLLGLTLPENPNEVTAGSAIDLLGATIRASTAKVTILTLGPLTNVAELVRDAPELRPRIEAVFVMGGAVDVAGNVYLPELPPQPVAEWNIYIDPSAANLVLASGVPVTLVALDATNDVPVSAAFAKRFADAATTASAHFVSDILGKLGDSIARGDYFFWDPFAAAVLADEGVASFANRSLGVTTDDGPDSGRIVTVPGNPEARYAVSGDPSRFEDLFLQALNGGGG